MSTQFSKNTIWTAVAVSLMSLTSVTAHALELNWSGQFWSEYHLVKNYQMNSDDAGANFDQTRANAGGYYIPASGHTASFETLFLRVRPKVVVNDNVYLKSEWWLGDPVFGLFGSAYPSTFDRRQYYSNQSRGSVISAQRFWGEFVSDFGTAQIGRIPLDWGLGLVWNAGDDIWSRYQSTGDGVRLVSKFGAFTLAPGFVVYSTGNAIGGTCVFDVATGRCIPGIGSGGVVDYSLMLKYENMEEDLEGGVNFVKRLSGAGQDPASGILGPQGAVNGMNYNVWDIYARKKLGKLNLAAELPVTSGATGGVNYSTVAVAAEVNYQFNETWEVNFKGGSAPGQSNNTVQNFGDKYKAFFFNPNYKIGTVLFNYQLANFAGYPGGNTDNNPNAPAQGQLSPWDNPIANATYITAGGMLRTDKWRFNTGVLYARAPEVAQTGQYFYNTWQRRQVLATGNQDHNLGFEWDLGAGFQWDENTIFRLDGGILFPGSFFKFSNVPGVDNGVSPVFAATARVGVNF